MKFRLDRVKVTLPKGVIFRSMGIVAFGTIVSQVLSVAMTPVLTRLYTPSDFGVITLFIATLGVLNTFDSCSYETAIPLPLEEGIARDLVALATSILVITSIICLLFLWGIDAFGILGKSHDLLGGLKFLLPVGMLGIGMFQILNLWTIRLKDFRTVARSKIFQSISLVTTQAGAGVAGLGAPGLIGGYLVGQFTGIGTMLRTSGILPLTITWKRMRVAASAYRKFPMFQMWATLAGAIGLQIPVFLLVRFFGTADAGNYGLTMRILGLPLVLFGQSVSQVFYPLLASSSSDPAAVRAMMERTIIGLLVPSVCIFGFTAVSAPALFPMIFGTAWTEAGQIAQILAPWFLLWFISSPISSILLVKQRQGTALILNLTEMILRVAAIWIGSRSGSVRMAIGALTCAGVGISGGFILLALHLSGSSLKQIWRQSPRFFGLTAITVGILAGLAALAPSLPLKVTLGSCVVVLLPFVIYGWGELHRVPLTGGAHG